MMKRTDSALLLSAAHVDERSQIDANNRVTSIFKVGVGRFKKIYFNSHKTVFKTEEHKVHVKKSKKTLDLFFMKLKSLFTIFNMML